MNEVSFCLVGIPPITQTKAKGRSDAAAPCSGDRRRPSGEGQGVSRQGPRTLSLQKNLQGFGFTLRHFIVYPPEPPLHGPKDEENGNATGKGCQRSGLEPMDTIFVKSVKEHGPAHQAGLCTGDRLVKVNGETVLGKTYSQVIALIQNRGHTLELCIMPKDQDVLQLVSVYSQDAYLRGSETHSGDAHTLPEPLCHPSVMPRPHHLLDNWQCRADGPAPPLDNCPPPAPAPPCSGVGEDSAQRSAPSGWRRGRSSSAIDALDFHFANHNAAIASATLPPPPGAPGPALCQQALSDWYHSRPEAAAHRSPRHRSVSHDRLAELGGAFGRAPGGVATTEQHRQETLLRRHQAAAHSHDSRWLGRRGGGPESGGGTCSESLLAAYADYEHHYGRSVDALAEASALVAPHRQRTAAPVAATPPPSGRRSGQQVAEPQTRRVKEEEPPGYRSYSPSFSRKAGHLLQQARSFTEPGHSAPYLDRSPGATALRPRSTPALSVSEEETARPGEGRNPSPVSLTPEVVLRQKPPAGRQAPLRALRHSLYATPAESPEPPSSGAPSPVPQGPGPGRRANGGLAQHALDSLSSIPFIDDPAGRGSDCPESSFQATTPTSVSPTLSVSPFVRLRSQDCSSIKGRRSSYLLAITTERSKSCDEGLNTFRDEGRVFSKLPKRVKSFFTDGSLESLRTQEEAQSKRHSTSDLGSVSSTPVRREGWLHYKQILTQKGKKVGGGMRPWKRAYTVLHCHSLFLYKDKREAVLHGAGAGPSQEEAPPIGIRGCLVDIAYSETKRKHSLRLTTQDFCEYLLQAEDRDDMLAWIRVIRENSRTDSEEIGVSRQALINKKLNDYRKHSLTGSRPDSSPKVHRVVPPFLLAKADNTAVNRASRSDDSKALWGIMKKTKKTDGPKAFGVRLEDCQPAVNHQFVPLIVETCCGVVETTGLEYTGIYRVPGNNAMVSNLQEHLNKGMDINTAEERWQDLNVISSLLKSFFRKLPEPLFTDDKYNDFIVANRIEDSEDRLTTMKKLIQDLPDHYYHTLKFLVGHLKRVADHSEKNKMEPRNLALVFGPTLVRTSEDNMTDMVTHMPDRYKIVETLILHYDWFFSGGELDKRQKKHDVQPVPNIEHLLSNIGRPGMPGEASDSTTSGSVKSKMSLGSKKDPNARDSLPKSFLSAVTRKRKKSLSGHVAGCSVDEDSDHEPVKTTNFGGGEAVLVSVEAEGSQEPIKGEHVFPKKEKRQGKENVALPADTAAGKGEWGKEADSHPRKDRGSDTKSFQKDGGQTTTSPTRQLHPNSFLCSHQHIHSTYPRAAPTTSSSPGNPNQARGRPTIPFWISPSRPPSLCQAAGASPDWTQSAPVRYRKTKGGRVRSTSMNLDLEQGRSEEGAGGREADTVEAVRVTQGASDQGGGGPRGSVVGPGPVQQLDPLPPSSSFPQWIHPRSRGPPTVVLRRSGQGPRDKMRAWRRHTVVV